MCWSNAELDDASRSVFSKHFWPWLTTIKKYISAQGLLQTHLSVKTESIQDTKLAPSFCDRSWYLHLALFYSVSVSFFFLNGGWDSLNWPSNESPATVWKMVLLTLWMAICWEPRTLFPLCTRCLGGCFPVLEKAETTRSTLAIPSPFRKLTVEARHWGNCNTEQCKSQQLGGAVIMKPSGSDWGLSQGWIPSSLLHFLPLCESGSSEKRMPRWDAPCKASIRGDSCWGCRSGRGGGVREGGFGGSVLDCCEVWPVLLGRPRAKAGRPGVPCPPGTGLLQGSAVFGPWLWCSLHLWAQSQGPDHLCSPCLEVSWVGPHGRHPMAATPSFSSFIQCTLSLP